MREVVCALLILLPGAAAAQPDIVQLSGLLTLQSFYGPPNYGEEPETDSVEIVPILELDQPTDLSVMSDARDGNRSTRTYSDVTRIELAAPIDLHISGFLGHKLIVEGVLFSAFTGHHHTDVLMDVQKIVSDQQ